MENRQLAITTYDNEYYIDPTNYLIRGKYIFIHKNNLQNNKKIILNINALVDVRSIRGERKALVFTVSPRQYVLLLRSHGEDEIASDLDEFDLVYKRNGNMFGDYVFNDLAINKDREE